MENRILCPQASKLVDQVFAVCYGLCDGFDAQFQDKTKLRIVKSQWIAAFEEHAIKEEAQIAGGLSELRKQTKLIYMPAIGQFLEWCDQQSMSLFMPALQAYNRAFEIMRGEDVNDLSQAQLEIILHAINETDRHFLRTASRSSSEPVFVRNYEISLGEYKKGKLKPIPKGLEYDESKEDKWKSLRKYGVLPQYAHLTSRDKAMPVIEKLIKKNGGEAFKRIPK